MYVKCLKWYNIQNSYVCAYHYYNYHQFSIGAVMVLCLLLISNRIGFNSSFILEFNSSFKSTHLSEYLNCYSSCFFSLYYLFSLNCLSPLNLLCFYLLCEKLSLTFLYNLVLSSWLIQGGGLKAKGLKSFLIITKHSG